ncbi:MAG: hypothetical protein ABII23_07580, partial [bacterium]
MDTMRLCVLILCLVCSFISGSELKEKPMNTNPRNVLESSQDKEQLMQAAISLARSGQPADQKILLKFLQSSEFLLRLNSKKEYGRSREFLLIGELLTELSQNRSPVAQDTLIKLTQSQEFVNEVSRIQLLIEAAASVYPAPADLIVFWERYAHPETDTVDLVIQALMTNANLPALQLFEKKMTDTAYSDNSKIYWMHYYIIPHRYNPGVLKTCEQLLQMNISEKLKQNLIETVFDYQPEWYKPHSDTVHDKRGIFSI